MRHAGYLTFQMDEVVVSRDLFSAILARIRRLRSLPEQDDSMVPDHQPDPCSLDPG